MGEVLFFDHSIEILLAVLLHGTDFFCGFKKFLIYWFLLVVVVLFWRGAQWRIILSFLPLGVNCLILGALHLFQQICGWTIFVLSLIILITRQVLQESCTGVLPSVLKDNILRSLWVFTPYCRQGGCRNINTPFFHRTNLNATIPKQTQHMNRLFSVL